MAETVEGFLGPAIEVVKWVAAPIKRQFNYLCCFSSNINNLKDEAKKLDDEAGGLQGRVDRERDSLRDIVPKVDTWLTKYKHNKDQTNTILDEVPNVESGCLKLRARFSLSKRAKKTTDRMKELRDECKFDAISQPGPPAAREAFPLGKTYEFESRKQIEEGMMTALRGGNVSMIGICGMGGLGKTTMAKRIMNRGLEEHAFEEVVMVVVSQQVDKSKIQEEIGGSLGLKLEEETSQAARIQKLHARLGGTKRILLVLDDVWQKLVLEDLGIPCNSKGCTILLTSRNRDALRAMSVENIFGMEVLFEKEAWFLFRETAGTCVDDTGLNSIAKEVVKECRGLPIALTIVGAALKDENDESIWEDALGQLRQCDPDILDFIGEVYNPLKLSYDFLDSKHAKSTFLLCSLFPEDASIRLEYLTYFCMGLGIFGGIRSVEVRNRMRALTKMLKSRSLLLDGYDEDHVRMHDVVRDVCIFIAKKEGYIGGNDCTRISSFQWAGESLLRRLFLIRTGFKLDSAFLEGIKDLYVLCIQRHSLTSLPHTTQSLTNLNTLVLDSCWGLKTISVVGEFVNLEILVCRNCRSIEELPQEIKRLNCLKLLELTECRKLQSIGRGIISSLVGLEELKMYRSFKKWEVEEAEDRENAGMRELEALTNLRCLEIEIEDPALAAEKMRLSSKMQRFHIRIAAHSDLPSKFNKKLSLELEGETCLGDWIEMQLLRDTECLYLYGSGANSVDLAKNQSIRWLELGECKTMKNIVRTSVVDDATVLPSIECLKLLSLPELQEICDGPISSNSFQNLSSIYINGCPRLRNLGQLSIAGNDCLSQLQRLHISKCEIMEQVFLWNEEEENKNNSESRNRHIKFPKLKEVVLRLLPNLATFYQGVEGIEFPLLKTMKIEECPKLTSIVSTDQNNSGSTSYADIDNSSHLFCQVSFGSLEKLRIAKCEGSMSLFTSSVAINLVSLTELSICECGEMVKVIEEEEKVASGGERTHLFPKLHKLELKDLPKLVSFSELKGDVELPSLKKVTITRCSDMKIFSLGSIAAPNLESFGSYHNNHHEVGVNVSFDSLKVLYIKGNENPLYRHKISTSLFKGLEKLEVSKYHGSMSLFSSSIAGNLVNLRELYVRKCNEMVKVIEDEEEKVVSTLLFPKLEELKLVDLPKLAIFCEWKCVVELPSLGKVRITSCSNMRNFTLGFLAAPNLKTVKIDDEDFGGAKDLNGALQQHLA